MLTRLPHDPVAQDERAAIDERRREGGDDTNGTSARTPTDSRRRAVVDVNGTILVIVAVIAALLGIALTSVVLEHTQRAAWRELARERRHRWEERQQHLREQLQVGAYDPRWDQDDD